MHRVGFQGAKTCQFFDVQISIKLRINKQLLDEVEHDIMNYQSRDTRV